MQDSGQGRLREVLAMKGGAVYPSKEQVESADREQMARWMRFLPSPGADFIGKPDFQEAMIREKAIMDLIVERFHQAGGMSPGISKKIGWNR